MARGLTVTPTHKKGQYTAIHDRPKSRTRIYPAPRRPQKGIMDTVTALGLIAGSLTTLSFAPQVIRAWRTRSTADLSFAMLVVFLAGILLWLVYGVVREDLAIIAANAITAVLIGLLLTIKKKHG